MASDFPQSHSPTVQAWLDCGEFGQVLLSRINSKSVVAKVAREIPPCFAELIVTIDGRRARETVNVKSGFKKGRRVARVTRINETPPF